jgi:DNA invertase Pin-like site-specific DNA recombinase
MTAAARMAPATRRCVIYVRISDDNLGREAGVTRQLKACQDEATRRGWDVVAVVKDNDRSASEYATKVRTGYAKVRGMVDTGAVDTVLAWSADRLHRRTDELDAWIRHTHGRAATVYVQGGEADYSTAMGKMAARMNGNMAAYESDVKSERVSLAMAQMRELGQWSRGAAFGWVAVDAETSPGHWVRRFTGKVDPVEGPAIVKACADLLSGKSLSAIAHEWNAAGLASSRGAAFGTTTVRAILHRGANAALVVHKGSVVGPGNWDAIVDEQTWRKVCRLLDNPARRTSTSTANVHLGAGIYRCGVCGDALRSAKSGRGITTYRCRKTGHVARSAAPIDALVTEYTLEALAVVKPVRLRPVDAVDPQAEIDRLRAKLSDLAADYAADAITRDEWTAARGIVQAKLDKLADVVAPDPGRDLVMATDADGFTALDLAGRRMLVARMWDVVVAPVARGVRADVADTVKVTPKAM